MSDSLPLGANPATAIAVDDDDDLNNDKDRQVNTIQLARTNLADRKRTPGQKNHSVKKEHDFSDEDYEQALLAEEDLVKEIKYVDLTDDGPTHPIRVRGDSGAGIPAPDTAATSQLHYFEVVTPQLQLKSGEVITPGSVVSLKEPISRFRIQFVKIQMIIINNENGQVRIRGLPYTRARCLDGQLLRKLNEVCLIGHIDEEDPRPWIDQAHIDIWESDIARVRCGLRTTNAPFPQMRFDDATYTLKGKKWVEDNEILVCRYHHYLIYRDIAKKKSQRAHQWVLVHVNEDMADAKYRVPDMTKINDWRGGKVAGGSFSPLGVEPEVISIDDDDNDIRKTSNAKSNDPVFRIPGQKYTVGDLFSGTGGASRGIQQAGFKVVFAVDHWQIATNLYKFNFPDVDCYQMEVDDFINSADIRYRVDILHLSPPCQVWSPAHTIAGQNDEKNMAALLSCSGLIQKIRPRVFTLEQTFGMLHSRFELFFNGLVGGFTDHGYSVRWGVINFNTWGLCQPRRRLVMVGACPGETLPDFPDATHAPDGVGGLLPLTTARQAIAHLRPGENHNPDRMPRVMNARVWDPDKPLPYTITCSGGHNCHWDGQRDFTIREYATLQGFPSRHRFWGSYLKRQIGNAFPPSMTQRLFEHLRYFLERVDNMTGARMAEHDLVEGREVIDLDDPGYDDMLEGIFKAEARLKFEGPLNPEGDTKPTTASKNRDAGDDSDDDVVVISHNGWRHASAGRHRNDPIVLEEEGNPLQRARLAPIKSTGADVVLVRNNSSNPDPTPKLRALSQIPKINIPKEPDSAPVAPGQPATPKADLEGEQSDSTIYGDDDVVDRMDVD